MKPASFEYVRAGSVEEACDVLLNQGDDTKVIAGGQSLVPMMNMRLVEPYRLLDIADVPALRDVESHDGTLSVGAAVTQSELLRYPSLAAQAPLLKLALPLVGHYQTRNRGTVGGSIAHADPSAELPLCLVALGGEVELAQATRTRCVGADDFFRGILTTACEPNEVITKVRFPSATAGQGYAFREVSLRHGDFALVACAAAAGRDVVRLAVGGVSDRPRATEFSPDSETDLDEYLDAFAWQLDARDDVHASARYRRELVRRLGRRTVEEALACRS